MHDTAKQASEDAADQKTIIQHMSKEAFLHLGVDHIAYIKPVTVDNEVRYSLHAADGKLLGLEESSENAAVTALSNALAPLTVH